MAKLVEGIDLSKLTTEGVEFNISSEFVKDESSSDDDNDEDMYLYTNKECVGLFDEDLYEKGEPFEIIATRMFGMLPDGKIKKRIIRQGDGIKPCDYDYVKIHYNAYVEYNDEPFDSTYVRKKPKNFVVNDGRVLAGLDFGVQSMKVNEKAQFLIHPDYAFGKNTVSLKIPANSTILFEVELLEVVPNGYATTYEKLSETQQELFGEVYKYCSALCEEGKKLFLKKEYKKAIIQYNTAAEKAKKVIPVDTEEKQKIRELQLRLYSNLLICHLRIDKPKKGCEDASQIYRITEKGELTKIPAKVFYNHAKCLRLLGEYTKAKEILNKAYNLEPKNPDIANEMIFLNTSILEDKNKQTALGKALLEANKEKL